MGLTSLLGRNTTDHPGAISKGFSYVERGLFPMDDEHASRPKNCEYATHSLSGEALAKNFGVLVDEQIVNGVLVGLAGSSL